jgi:hypothetical protein
LEQTLFKEREIPCARLLKSHLLFKGDSKMTKHDQELLEKQLWGVSSRPSQNGTIILTIVAVFLAGRGIGDILSKQANTNYAQANANYAAAIPRIAEAPP